MLDRYAPYRISILTVCISSRTVRNRSLCTNIVTYANILYEDRISRISAPMPQAIYIPISHLSIILGKRSPETLIY